MGAGTTAAIVGSTLLGAGSSYLSARGQRRAAERQARAASQPQRFEQTSTSGFSLDPAIRSSLDDLLARFSSAAYSGSPEFPEFHGFNFTPTQLPDFNVPFFNYDPLETPSIPGASGTSKGILRDILGLTETSPFLDPVAENFEDILSGDANEYFDDVEAFLASGPLAGIAAGAGLSGANPFEDQVVDALRRDSEESLERILAGIESDASGIRRSGGRFAEELKTEARQRAAEDFEDLAARERSANFENEAARQIQAGGINAEMLNSMLGIRSGDIRSAVAAAPALENARFTGLGLAGDLSSRNDQLAQAARMFEAGFGQREHQFDASAEQAAIADAVNRFMFENQFKADENRALAGYAAQLAGMKNQFGQSKALFDLEAPYFGLNQLGNFLLPLAELTGQRTSTTSGFNQQNVAPGYTPSPWGSAFSGGLGGYLLGKGFNAGGGSNFSSSSLISRARSRSSRPCSNRVLSRSSLVLCRATSCCRSRASICSLMLSLNCPKPC